MSIHTSAYVSCYTLSDTIPRPMPARTRFDRSVWLEAALDSLWMEGIEGVKVEPLARRLEVTKGSFYHHFTGREELLRAMVDRWQATQDSFLEGLGSAPARDPSERLEQVMEFIDTKDARHDIAMRGWARVSLKARKAVEAIDARRLRFLEELFVEMGFSGDAAALRSRLIYFYQVAEQTVAAHDDADTRARLRALRYTLLTERS